MKPVSTDRWAFSSDSPLPQARDCCSTLALAITDTNLWVVSVDSQNLPKLQPVMMRVASRWLMGPSSMPYYRWSAFLAAVRYSLAIARLRFSTALGPVAGWYHRVSPLTLKGG